MTDSSLSHKSKQPDMQKRPSASLRILIATHQLTDFTGSEIFTYTIAANLVKRGHKVIVYSPYLDSMAPLFQSLNIPVFKYLDDIESEFFDVAHVHHNIIAAEVRRFFRSLPIVFLSHGVLPFLEQRPLIDLAISNYLAVSEEVRNRLISTGIEPNRVSLFRNLVDPSMFFPQNELSAKPRNALVISNRMNPATEQVIRDACTGLGISCEFLGMRFRIADPLSMPYEINKADLVFTLGRGIVETMMCGRIPIVFDYTGGDGMVTPDKLEEMARCNFSGRRYGRNFSRESLSDEIALYDVANAPLLRQWALDNCSVDAGMEILEEHYYAAMPHPPRSFSSDELEILEFLVQSIRQTRGYSRYELRKLAKKQGISL